MARMLLVSGEETGYDALLRRRGCKATGYTPVPELGREIPTTVIVGNEPGKTLFVTTGVHGAEYCGIEATAQFARVVEPADVCGAVIVWHCCNQRAFFGHVVGVMPEDGENLNRVFPTGGGHTHTHRISRFLEGVVVDHADFHVDVHSGDANEALYPHVYYSANEELGAVAEMSRSMALQSGMPYAVASFGTRNVFQNSNFKGVPSVLLEMGQQGRWSPEEARSYRDRLLSLTLYLGVVGREARGLIAPGSLDGPVHDVAEAVFLDAERGGRWLPNVQPGERICAGQKLGRIENFFGDLLSEPIAQRDGVVLYMTSSLSVQHGAPLIAYACM